MAIIVFGTYLSSKSKGTYSGLLLEDYVRTLWFQMCEEGEYVFFKRNNGKSHESTYVYSYPEY